MLSTIVMPLGNIYHVDAAGDRVGPGIADTDLGEDTGLIDWKVPPDERYGPKPAV